jgi:hypothetical protein
MSNVSQWNVSAGSNNAAPPNGAPEGWAPSAVNDTVREVMAALARWYSDTKGSLVTAGTANARTLTTNNSHAALADQSFLVFRSNLANTGATTLNVDGLGAKAVRSGGSALVSGALAADKLYVVVYNATDDAYDLVGSANLTANQTVDHSTVSVIAGDGLTGGGTIAANRTLNVGAGTGISVASTSVGLDTSNSRNVDHSAVSVSAGNGLTGGGTIAANRTLTLGAGGTVSGSSTNSVTTSSHTHALDGAVLRNVTSGQSSGSVTVSTSGPSGGANGDIWLEREA